MFLNRQTLLELVKWRSHLNNPSTHMWIDQRDRGQKSKDLDTLRAREEVCKGLMKWPNKIHWTVMDAMDVIWCVPLNYPAAFAEQFISHGRPIMDDSWGHKICWNVQIIQSFEIYCTRIWMNCINLYCTVIIQTQLRVEKGNALLKDV